MMAFSYKRGLLAWAVVLLIALVMIVPASAGLSTLAMAAIAVGAATLWRWMSRRQALQAGDLHLAAGASLPAPSYKRPVVLVCGDRLPELFGAPATEQVALRSVPQGCYLQVATLQQLPLLVAALLAQRPQWRDQLSVLLVVDPGAHTDNAVLAAHLRSFCYQLGLARREGCALPLLLSSYLHSNVGMGPWFSWKAGQQQLHVREAGQCTTLAQWQAQAGAQCGDRLRASVQLECLTGWLAEHVISHFSGPEARHRGVAPLACAISAIAPAGVNGNLWRLWQRECSGLDAAHTPAAASTRLPFPDPLLHLLPRRVGRGDGPRAIGLALWLLAGAVLIAMASSAWHNHLLVRQVTDDLALAKSAAPPLHEAALQVLRNDALQLDAHYREGAPLALGLGLYRGGPLRAPVHAALALHGRHPQPTPAATYQPVRLDSLSLFSSGSAELKPGATKVLINALVSVKAQPGWLIVIAGHTDATGNAALNLSLSRARAAAVRDWMQRMGDLHASCFAVQGFGASQPLASNASEIGRAQNRRVDIRLVPEAGACVAPAATGGSEQSQHATLNH